MQFGFMFFASGEDALLEEKYRLVIESARFADRHGFKSVWVPERHFTQFGCLYPNPAVLHAALARETKRIQLRAGSVVLPLHSPIRVAEEWAVVDNLSDGRVGISFAAGWNPNDFAGCPDRYADRYDILFAGIQTVQKLWRGESIWMPNGKNIPVEIRIYPTPIQSELPIWVTAAGSPKTFIRAGEIGANLLTHLFDHTVEELAEKIALYREARSRQGYDPATGQITVTLHTLIGDDLQQTREQARKPYCNYLKSNLALLKGLAESRGSTLDVTHLSTADLEALANLVFEKFAASRSLIGTPESCLPLIQQLEQLGVDEVACLLDFGLAANQILDHLPPLSRLKEVCTGADSDLRNGSSDRPSIELPSQNLLREIQVRCFQSLPALEFYENLLTWGVEFDHSFQGIQQLWRRDGEALGDIHLLEILELNCSDYALHPAFLDACLQVFFAALPRTIADQARSMQYLPVGFQRLKQHRPLEKRVWSHAIVQSELSPTAEQFEGTVQILDQTGAVLIEIIGLRLQRVISEPQLPEKPPEDWFYQIEWQSIAPPVAALQPADWLRSPQQITAHFFPSAPSELSIYQELNPQLEILSTTYILSAFQQLGWNFSDGAIVSTASLTELGIATAHQRLLERLLQILQEDEILCRLNSTQWKCNLPAHRDASQQWNDLWTTYPACRAELTLLERCGTRLADVLQGQCDPLQLLFPDGSLDLVEQLYQHAPAAQVMNRWVQQTIAEAVNDLPNGRQIRILEIGAGTGGTTAQVLPSLPAAQTEYWFTDVSRLMTARAEQKFCDYPFVRCGVLDIEQDPQSQDFASQQFDVILAANVLHATTDLQQTLKHVQQLLAPGGLLVLLEGTQPQRSLDLVFGLTEGWWKFTDRSLRPDYPLLGQERWCELLKSTGFAEVRAIAPEGIPVHQAVIVAQTPVTVEDWLILADQDGVGTELAEQLRVAGKRVSLVQSDRSEEHYRSLLQKFADETTALKVIHLGSLDLPECDRFTTTELELASGSLCSNLLSLLQALTEFGKTPQLWLVTQGSQSVKPTDPQAIIPSLLWGLGQVIAVEQPQLWGGLIDLDPSASVEQNAAALLQAISSDSPIAYRQGEWYTPRLVQHQATVQSAIQVQSEGSYLLTGGFGDLGLLVAQWLVRQGSRHLILVGRSSLPPRSQWDDPQEIRVANQIQTIRTIEASGATVYLESADVADEAQMIAALHHLQEQGCPKIRGVMHLAGIPQPMVPLQQLDQETLTAVLRPKVLGSWVLHRLFANQSLDWFVLFSSWAGLLGAVGQQLGSYSAANAFLDTLAHYRRSHGQTALSIAWGDWAEVGMRSRYVQQGYRLLPDSWTLLPEQGLAALEHLLYQDAAQVAVLPVPWSEFFQLFPDARSSLLQQIASQPTEPQKSDAQSPAWLQTLESLPANGRLEALQAHIQEQAARVLGIQPPHRLDPQRGLFELGMDSLMALELKHRLESSLGCSIPAILAFEHPTVSALTTHLAQTILGWEELTIAPAIAPDIDLNDPLTKIQQLSDDEVERLLSEKISRASL
ncbi:MupA/Atu3671 family FMN-dependent luciferase-like monooxygenase [Myxacorys almedinensis]|uniref:LLM class flavin-dependent oxidoreductase n=1 Tax=Myxacorys almedinensis A TaxID=2690445 RepID=A0A8J7Z3F0_9CYAN|nr:MupA/Atu3671 family FMN-dependent luciferase-like monooxygenase [Myxacorys almedinensis]NDJ18580.1 LLM class flavin-dependent oxidoreductase [Myxacorys almedinensis A]